MPLPTFHSLSFHHNLSRKKKDLLHCLRDNGEPEAKCPTGEFQFGGEFAFDDPSKCRSSDLPTRCGEDCEEEIGEVYLSRRGCDVELWDYFYGCYGGLLQILLANGGNFLSLLKSRSLYLFDFKIDF